MNSDAPTTVITADKLTVQKGATTVLDTVSFAIGRGKITGLIGPSGSGKTTLMRCIMGAQEITSGTLQVLGSPAGSATLRSQLGYVTQTPAVYDDLNVYENLEYFAAILDVGKEDITRVIKEVELLPQTWQVVSSLSGGQRARVSLAIALLGNPQILILDEPTVGLDPVLRKHLWQFFRGLAEQGRTLVISSHVMDEAEQCPELMLLRDGKVLSHGSKADLLKRTHTQTVEEAFLKLAEKEQA
jgi:ABC-2 type transport system ATP-binding protein